MNLALIPGWVVFLVGRAFWLADVAVSVLYGIGTIVGPTDDGRVLIDGIHSSRLCESEECRPCGH